MPSFCLYFIHHTDSLVSSCLLLTETKKKPKSKSPPSSERTTYVPVTAEHDTVDLLDQDFSDEEEEDQAGFAQGHSQSGKVARKEPRGRVQQARKESGKEQAARIRREEREEALKQQQLALNQENLARKRKHQSSSQDHSETSLSAFRKNKEQARRGNPPTGSDGESSGTDDDGSDEEEAPAKENHNPNIMGTPATCNKNACKAAVKDAKNWKDQYDAEFDKNAKLTETNAKLNSQVEVMEKKLEKLLEELKQAMKNAGTLEFSQAQVDSLTKTAKNVLFYKYQFTITSTDEKRLAKRIYCILYDKSTREALGSTHMQQWILTYHNCVGNAIGNERHFRNQQLQGVCRKYVKDGKDLPSVDLFEKVLMGKADLEDEDEREAVIFIWDKVAGAIAGQSNWGPNIRANNLMYTAKSQTDNEVSFVHLALIRLQVECVLQLTPPCFCLSLL